MEPQRVLKWGAITLLAGGLLAFAACGDDDDGDDEALTDEAYFSAVDGLEGDLDALFGSDTGAENAEEFGDLVVAELQGYRNQLDDLNPPEDLEDTHNEYVDLINDAVDSIEDGVGDFTADDPPEAIFEIFGAEDVVAVEEFHCTLRELAEERGIDTPNLCPPEEEGVDPSAPPPEDPSTLPAEETTEVLIEGFNFQPAHIQVSAGDTVTWMQGADGAPHTATADDASFDTGLLEEEGATGEVTFDTAGDFSYFCEVHPDMLGLVTVVE